MAKVLSKPEAQDLLFQIEPQRASARVGDLSHRRRLLRGACSAVQLFIRDSSHFFDARGRTPVFGKDTLETVATLRTELASSGVVSIGLHIVDPVCGRISRMWTSPDWSFKLGGAIVQPGALGWTFSHLWLKSYWQLLRTSSTLLNALHEGMLPWNGTHVSVAWDEKRSAESILALPVDDPFVTGSRRLAVRFAEVIGVHAMEARNGLDKVFEKWLAMERNDGGVQASGERSTYDGIIDATVTQVVEKLTRECFLAQTRELCEDLRRRILLDEELRSAFTQTLDNLEGRPSELTRNVSDWSALTQSVRHGEDWPQVLVRSEALQSCIMNEGAWTAGSLIVDRVTGLRAVAQNDTTCYLVLGFGSAPSDAVRPAVLTLNHSVMNLLEAVQEALDGASIGAPAAEVGRHRRLREEIMEHMPISSSGMSRWLDGVIELSSCAVHERRPLQFNVGYGPAFLAQTQLRRFERSPVELSAENVDLRRVSNFIKAYFSLFGASSRIIWFDPQGRFMGVYESPEQQRDSEWQFGWGKRYRGYFVARILGLDRFEVYDEDGNPLVRAIDGRVTRQTNDAEIKEAIERACTPLFGLDWHGEVATMLAAALLAKWKRHGHGTSLVVVGDQRKEEPFDAWRAPLSAQLRSLVPRLRGLDRPILSLTESLEAVKEVAAAERLLLPFGEIDGALVLVSETDGSSVQLKCLPGRQVVPLVPLASEEDGGVGPLDFESWLEGFNAEGFDPDSLPALRDSAVLGLNAAKFVVATIRNPAHLNMVSAEVRSWLRRLEFLQSAGTRHHSLWGISLTAKEQLVAITLSDDGRIGVFWDGRNFMEGD